MGPEALGQVISQLPLPVDPNLLVGTNTADDAAVYRLTDDIALVQTVDFFTPVVDDPFDFGRIAAANSFSDIYAMGAQPRLALNIVAFPATTLPLTMLRDLLLGGLEVAEKAEVTVVGGHTIDDPEPKYGMAVTGIIKPGSQLTNASARPGDVLVLTKPLGTGIVATAIKRGMAAPAVVAAATGSMVTLNRDGAEAAIAHHPHALTDVTGFGLSGHLGEMCAGSGVSAEIWLESLPILPGAVELAQARVAPGGTQRNLAYVADQTSWPEDISDWERYIVADPQTSGGLLVSVPEEEAPGLIADLRAKQTPAAAVIGRVLPLDQAGRLLVRRSVPVGYSL